MVEQTEITEDEAALYDRQIRLWGLDAQRRLRAARVLLIGVRGLGAEVAKNIVLAGVKSLTLLDHTNVTEEDACSNFLVARTDVGKNRAECSRDRTQLLNPMVDVTADPQDVDNKPDDFYKNFDVICALCCKPTQLYKINTICSENKIKFYCGDVMGYYGYMFSDLGFHEYAEEVQRKVTASTSSQGDGEPATKKAKTDEMETVTVKNSAQFTRFKDAMTVDWKSSDNVKKVKRTPSAYFIMKVLLQFMENEGRRPAVSSVSEDKKLLSTLKSEVLEQIGVNSDLIDDEFTSKCFAELSPVCAIVGGVLGQEIIKAVSHKDAPHNNFFFYNGVEGSGLVDKIGS
ncbi:SUMO-activating enzyme subunit 1-like [Ruditapes philippinarum]|uniref:SUMO-activating enzyme subunit 1-like n=1 Tax=Ruditapes philippinarum TaxID=129788 RepID=UPI00295BAE2D|nr:SUMO-activating enzyme subunit 1-like [Ruditapes philippinarum]